jgi:hypothetical protein
LHSGPSAQRLVPYQNDAHNQQPQKTRQHKGEGNHGIMEKLTITTPSDVLSFIGHTLGFWPQESLVCITMNDNSIGATLRIDLPRQPGQELPYARTVAHYLTSDTTATSILFAVYTSETATPGQARPHAGTIAALTGVLAEQGITIRDGLFVGDETFSPYDGEPGTSLALPVNSTQTSAINAEFIYRGSFIEPTDRITLPTTSQEAAKAAAVEHHMEAIASQPTDTALQQGRKLWADMLDSKTFPAMTTATPSSRTCSSPQSATGSSQTSPEWTNPCNRSCSPKPQKPRSGHESSGHNNSSCTPTPAPAPNTQHPSSQPSATSTGGKAEAAKHTNSSNSPSTPTPPTASPASATK